MFISHASSDSTMVPSCASMKRKAIQIEAPQLGASGAVEHVEINIAFDKIFCALHDEVEVHELFSPSQSKYLHYFMYSL